MSEATIVFRTWDYSHGGKSWTLRRPHVGVEKNFAKEMERLDLDAVRRHRDTMDMTDYAVNMEAWQYNSGAGNKYGWNSMAFRQCLQMSNDANVFFLYHWFGAFYNQRTCKEKDGLRMTIPRIRDLWWEITPQKNEETGETLLDEKGQPAPARDEDGAVIYAQREILSAMIREAINDPNPLPPSAN